MAQDFIHGMRAKIAPWEAVEECLESLFPAAAASETQMIQEASSF